MEERVKGLRRDKRLALESNDHLRPALLDCPNMPIRLAMEPADG